MNKFRMVLSFLVAAVILAGCASSKHRSSSVVDYLYPNEKNYVEKQSIPHLNLPLRVGIAFVPEAAHSSMVLTETDKMDIMSKVSDNFKKYDFVKSIEVIPSAYLTRGGSFTNLEQVKNMYGVDVIALISFDQTQFTDQGSLSFTYWTIIGAYIIPAEKNDTHTMLDAVVYDIQSRKMLFRAPGTHKIKSNSTPINLTEQLREDSFLGFEESQKKLIKNLEIQLELFKNKVKESPESYKITKSQGYSGGGSIDSLFLFLLTLIGGYKLFQKRKGRA